MLGGILGAHAQVGIGIKKPSESAMLHIHSEQGNQGLIIPKVFLTDISVFAPVQGNPNDPVNIGLMVFNNNEDGFADLSQSYYYWSGSKWLRIVDEELLNRILNDLTPYDSSSGNPDLKGTYQVRYNLKDNNFYTVQSFEDGSVLIDKIAIDQMIKRDETKTQIARRYDDSGNEIGKYVISTENPISEKGKIVYNYKSEDQDYYIDITQDIVESVQNNERIRNEISNLITSVTQEGGNVFYGPLEGHDTDRLYRQEKGADGKPTKKLIDIGKHVLDFFTNSSSEIHETVRNAIGYDITFKPVSTGNKFEGEHIYVFSDILDLKEDDAEVSLKLSSDIRTIIKSVYSISILDPNGNALNVNTSEISLGSGQISFALGSGSLYTSLPTGSYTAVIEFLKK